jgi:hypothetical protein
MRKRTVVGLSILMVCAATAQARMTVCQMKFNLKGWSMFYKTASGTGTIRCDNGQKANVTLSTKGGGLTAGKTEIKDGIGKFSEVSSINELFGTYVSSGAEAGAGKSASAMAMTKGDVHLALTGQGKGVQLGISFGRFTIEKKK